jgi:hypothetical protein
MWRICIFFLSTSYPNKGKGAWAKVKLKDEVSPFYHLSSFVAEPTALVCGPKRPPQDFPDTPDLDFFSFAVTMCCWRESQVNPCSTPLRLLWLKTFALTPALGFFVTPRHPIRRTAVYEWVGVYNTNAPSNAAPHPALTPTFIGRWLWFSVEWCNGVPAHRVAEPSPIRLHGGH